MKDERKRIRLHNTDLYMADFSYALLERINGREAILYNAVLFNAKIKNSDFSKACFRGADLKGARFTNVMLDGADFTDATNVPQEILGKMENGVVKSASQISTIPPRSLGTVFFSMPGCLGKREFKKVSQNIRKL